MDPYTEAVSAELEANFETIKKEVLALVDRETLVLTKYSSYNSEIGRDVHFICPAEKDTCEEDEKEEEGWKVATISVGKTVGDIGKKYTPTLVDITQRHGLMSVVVSHLPGETGIPPHVGYSSAVKRLMLAIEVPDDSHNCFLCVNGKKQIWKPGKTMLWDDTFVHSVKNLTNQRRIVVYMDVIRKTGKSNLDWLIRNMMNIAMNSNSVKEYIRSTETKQKLRS